MSTGLSLTEAVRALLLLFPRVVGRVKRAPIPDELKSVAIAPRHLSLFSYLQFDGPMPVNELAARLEVAPATVSLMIGDLSRKGLIERREDDADRRRTIVSIAPNRRAAIEKWIVAAAGAWQTALEPLTDEQRQTFVATLARFEEALNR
ncbi:MarR family winged helix-turn-helix transcriptional regulator [Actinophytocola sp.]|uniref:MarR family winged helix-turn-helix transcriptional regulator n=1 Tax=Actinophytocola sp. TaxID=1872138 RepID=UPI002ED55738